MLYQIITEGSVRLRIPIVKKISRAMPVFYNPLMAFNRDIAILLLKSLNKKHLRIADPLAGTGIRGVRFLRELPQSMIESVVFNDTHKNFKKNIAEIIRLNHLQRKKIGIHNQDATLFLLKSTGFDYIDIDPFGSPNQYLDAAVRRLSRDGILAVTATDTSALAGSHLQACRRKYWAEPLHNELMHEMGLRILTRKVQLVGGQFDKALIPIFAHATAHYYRIYFQCRKGKRTVDDVIHQHQFLLFCHQCRTSYVSKNNTGTCSSCGKQCACAGPLWIGTLWNTHLVNTMLKKAPASLQQWLTIIHDESIIPVAGFYALPQLCKKLHCSVPKKDNVLFALKKAGFAATATHFAGDALKTTAPFKKLIRFIQHR